MGEAAHRGAMRLRGRAATWAMLMAAALAVPGYALWRGHIQLPERYNPWAELEVDAPPNWLTALKLRRAQANALACLAALDKTGIAYERVPDRVTGPGCGFEDAVRVQRGQQVRLGSPLILSCRTALSFAMWERHGLQPAAQKNLQTPIVAIEHLGSYACRNINTGKDPESVDARRSRHATADALDIAGFVTQDGLRIRVERDWQGGAAPAGTAPSAFLRDVHSAGCRFFSGVLGPDYNAVHRDHFHLEVGGWRMCT
jgi:hypothetical protein